MIMDSPNSILEMHHQHSTTSETPNPERTIESNEDARRNVETPSPSAQKSKEAIIWAEGHRHGSSPLEEMITKNIKEILDRLDEERDHIKQERNNIAKERGILKEERQRETEKHEAKNRDEKKARDEEMEKLHADNAMLSTALISLKTDSENIRVENEKLKSRVSELKETLEKERERLGKEKIELDESLRKEVQAAQQELRTKEGDLSKSKTELSNQQAECERLAKEAENHKSLTTFQVSRQEEQVRLEQEVEELQKSKKLVEERVKALTSQVEDLKGCKQRASSLETQVRVLEDDVKALKKYEQQVSRLEKEVRTLKVRIVDREQEVQALKIQLDRPQPYEEQASTLEKEVKGLKAQLSSPQPDEKQASALEDEVQILKAQLDSLQPYENQVIPLNKQKQRLQTKLDRLQPDNSKTSRLKEEVKELELRAAGVEKQHQYITELSDQVNQLKRNADEQRSKEEKYQTEIARIQRAMMEKERDRERLEADNRKLKNNIKGVQEELKSLQGQNKELIQAGKGNDPAFQRMLENLQTELKEKQDMIIDLEKRVEIQEEFLASEREKAWEKVIEEESREIQTMDDEGVKHTIHVDIETRCKQWADKYVITKLDERSFRPSATLDAEVAKTAGAYKDVKTLCNKYDADIVVHALLVQYITENVLNKPFLAFELETHAQFAAKLAQELNKRILADPLDGYKWRQQQLQWLEPTMPRESSDGDAQIKVDDGRCTELAKGFLNGPAKVLLKSDPRKQPLGLEDLKVIMKEAIRVGLLIWRQPVDVQIRGYQQLRVRRFAINDKEIKTHRSQSDIEKLLGNDVAMDMVIQPSIVVKQGELPEKVWSQAVVLWNY